MLPRLAARKTPIIQKLITINTKYKHQQMRLPHEINHGTD